MASEKTKERVSPKEKPKRTRLRIALVILAVVCIVVVYVGWDRLLRERPQPDWVTHDDATRFMYASIGAERDAGIPYWIFYVLPRMFPEKFPGSGGYLSLGLPWQEGHELPVGFAKKTIGFPRVGNNCAVCHTARYRTAPGAKPIFVPLGPAHTSNVEAYLRLLIECARDPRFNSDNIMIYIGLATKLDWIDTLLYRFFIIPLTKKRLLESERRLEWVYNEDYPEWGRGRDDAMNLTKYFMIGIDPADDGTFGPTDFPAIWNLAKYDTEGGQRLNLAGDTWDAYSVVMDSALGLLGAEPHDKKQFVEHVQWLTDYAKRTPPPAFPFPIDEARAEAGKAVFDHHCAVCHAADSRKRGATAAGRGHRYQRGPPRDLGQALRRRGQPGGRTDGAVAPRPGGRGAHRLQRASPRRGLAPRSLSAQRLGAELARLARTG